MTTNKQLQEWLVRFPDDALIEVIKTYEYTGSWDSNVTAHHEDLELPDVQTEQLYWTDNFANVSFEISYNYDAAKTEGVNIITLGKAHND